MDKIIEFLASYWWIIAIIVVIIVVIAICLIASTRVKKNKTEDKQEAVAMPEGVSSSKIEENADMISENKTKEISLTESSIASQDSQKEKVEKIKQPMATEKTENVKQKEGKSQPKKKTQTNKMSASGEVKAKESAQKNERKKEEVVAPSAKKQKEETVIKSEDVAEKEGTEQATKKLAPRYRVTYDKEQGNWIVKKDGRSRATRRVSTKEEALKIAKELCENQDVDLTVHKKNGKFQKLR